MTELAFLARCGDSTRFTDLDITMSVEGQLEAHTFGDACGFNYFIRERKIDLILNAHQLAFEKHTVTTTT